jgi:hypothetical protein
VAGSVIFALRILLDQLRLLQHLQKRQARSVAVGNLRPIKLDRYIVDVQPVDTRKDMLDRVNLRPVQPDRRPTRHVHNVVDVRRDRRIVGQVHPVKHHPGVHGRRLERHGRQAAGMQPYARKGDFLRNCLLFFQELEKQLHGKTENHS